MVCDILCRNSQDRNQLFTRRGSILGTLHLFITLFRIFQYDYGDIPVLFTSLPRFVEQDNLGC